MPEGLSPIEVGRELHEHTKEPHRPDGTRHSRLVQIGEALPDSLVASLAAPLANVPAAAGIDVGRAPNRTAAMILIVAAFAAGRAGRMVAEARAATVRRSACAIRRVVPAG